MCQAPSSTAPLYITEAKFTQPSSEEGLLDIPRAPSMTSLLSLVMLVSLLSSDTALATLLAKDQTLGIGSLSTSGKHSLGRPSHRSRACESAQLCLSSMTSPPLATSPFSRALAFLWSCWYEEDKGKWERGTKQDKPYQGNLRTSVSPLDREQSPQCYSNYLIPTI